MVNDRSKNDNDTLLDSDAPDASSESSSNNPLAILFAPDPAIWKEARKLIGDTNTRVENLATVCVQDPVIMMELLRISNAMYFSAGRSAITSPRTAIVRLGSDVVLETLDKLAEREPITDLEVKKQFDIHRSRCKRTGIVCRLFAEAIARNLSDDCQAAGCMISVGEMLAVAYLKHEYVELAEQFSRSGLNYRLSQNKQFNVEKMGLNYLRRYGIPEALLYGIDRDARSRSPERSIMKPLCFAASELVDAFDGNRWEKLAPGKNLPPKSSIRLLQISESQYLKIYERASEYLFSARMIEERQRQSVDAEEIYVHIPIEAEEQQQDALESEIQGLIHSKVDSDTVPKEVESASEIAEIEEVTESPEMPSDIDDAFSLHDGSLKKKETPRVSEPVPVIEPPKLRTSKGNAFISSVTDLFSSASSSEDLLADLLQKLTDGPFEKAALIVVSKDRKFALVVAARGPIGNGQKISLTDPLSPLARCFSKVQSFSSKPNEASPFGSKSFALAPIDVDHETPVALYADCGEKGALSFEARRIFRNVVELLNQKLPGIPGGLPVELEQA